MARICLRHRLENAREILLVAINVYPPPRWLEPGLVASMFGWLACCRMALSSSSAWEIAADNALGSPLSAKFQHQLAWCEPYELDESMRI